MLGKTLIEKDFVFAHPDGTAWDPSTITHAFKNIIRKAGLPRVRLHDLRHTHATLMLKAGVHPKIVSERLGHTNIGITLDTYSHVVPGLQQAAAKCFDDMLEPTTRKQEDVGKMSARGSGSEARPKGFEPPTLGSEDRCSCPLSYGRPI